jgi:hypothetical protein
MTIRPNQNIYTMNKMIGHSLIMGLILFANTALADNLPITDIFPQQSQYHTHGSNLQFYLNQDQPYLFTVWFQGDGERQGSNVTIFGSLLRIGSSSAWANPVQITKYDPNFPDVNPALYISRDQSGNSQLQLYWEKIYYSAWKGAEVHSNNATLPTTISSWQDLTWEDPTLEGTPISSQDTVLFPPGYSTILMQQFDNTWPLVNGKFNPFTLQGSKIRSRELYSSLKAKLNQIEPKNFALLKQNQNRLMPLYRDTAHSAVFFKAISQANNYSEALANFEKSIGDDLQDLLTAAYWLYDLYVSSEMENTVLNKDSEFFKKGWETRSQPLSIKSPQGTTRLLLPLYSDSLNISLVIYSDDNGKTWHRAQNPIMSRAGIQPSLVELDDGRIMALLRNNGGILNLNSALCSYSTDGGLTWSAAVPVLDIPNQSSSLSLIKLHSDKYSGRLALVFNPDSGRNVLTVALSKDKFGTQWIIRNLEVAPEDGPESFQYPSITEDPNNAILYISFSHTVDATHCSSQQNSQGCQNIGVINVNL